MDERKTVIKELENKKQELAETRKQLLEGLGETLLQRIEKEPFPEPEGDGPGVVLAEYRKLQKEIIDASEIINTLELDVQRLKELERDISVKEGKQSLLKEELEHVYTSFGMAMLNAPDSNDLAGLVKQQEESLLAKIEEHQKILYELEEPKSGVVAWIGKNAKVAVEKAILLKNRSDLQKLYRRTGEEYFSTEHVEIPEGEAAEDAKKALELRESQSSLAENLVQLKEERRRIGGTFSPEGSPSQRIQKYQKHINQTKKEFPALYIKLGSLAAADDGKKLFSSFLTEDDLNILEKAEALVSQIAEEELSIKKTNAAISIDKEKAGVEKRKKQIESQRLKITAAEEAIDGLEKQIAESEQHIEELEAIVQGDHGSKN